jgi:Tfp pilus assembly protein PilZ/CheY-like chemotaxis protein
VGLKKAVLVDRDGAVLAKLGAELKGAGYLVESLDSTLGLTPDLLARSEPDLLVMDAELPGLEMSALLVLVRSMRARQSLKVVISTSGEPGALQKRLSPDQVIRRSKLLAEGTRALGVLTTGKASSLDVRALIDEVLGGKPEPMAKAIQVRVDLFSQSNFYVPGGEVGGGAPGLFWATASPPPVGQKVDLSVDLNGSKLKLAGEVVWQRAAGALGPKLPPGVGIRLDSAPNEGAAIQKFFEFRQPISWPG